ncbi:hypothetical protein C8R43DRAFT_1241611 [Mycena crocata]|nr:hypothetical protein C8R43DRAFT_1241611 [Mycena crocata]
MKLMTLKPTQQLPVSRPHNHSLHYQGMSCVSPRNLNVGRYNSTTINSDRIHMSSTVPVLPVFLHLMLRIMAALILIMRTFALYDHSQRSLISTWSSPSASSLSLLPNWTRWEKSSLPSAVR